MISAEILDDGDLLIKASLVNPTNPIKVHLDWTSLHEAAEDEEEEEEEDDEEEEEVPQKKRGVRTPASNPPSFWLKRCKKKNAARRTKINRPGQPRPGLRRIPPTSWTETPEQLSETICLVLSCLSLNLNKDQY